MEIKAKSLKGQQSLFGTLDRLTAVSLLILVLLVLWETRELPLGTLQKPGAAFMPVLLACFLGGISIFLLIFGGNSPPLRSLEWPEAKHAAVVLAACGFAALALDRIGYRLTMTAVLVFLLGVVERNRLAAVFSLAIGFALLSYWIFRRLGVLLPQGPLGL